MKHHTMKFRLPLVSMTSTTYGLVLLLKDNFGGTISLKKSKKEHHKQAFDWKVQGDKAIAMMGRIIPYMREPKKLSTAQLIYSKYKLVTPRNGKYTEQLLKEKMAFENEYHRIRVM